MEPTRTETVEGLIELWAGNERYTRALDASVASTPSRCEGWSVADVAAHMAGNLTDLATGNTALGTSEKHVEQRKGRSFSELADEIRESGEICAKILRVLDDNMWGMPSPVPDMTIQVGVEALWLEAYLHEDDIRAVVGAPPRGGAGLEFSIRHVVWHLEKRGYRAATLALDGMPLIAVGGGGPEITGDAHRFLLAATGRIPAGDVGLDADVNVFRD